MTDHPDAELVQAVAEALDLKRRDRSLTDDDLERLIELTEYVTATQAHTDLGRASKAQLVETEVADLLGSDGCTDLVLSLARDLVGSASVIEADGNLIGRPRIVPKPPIANVKDLRWAADHLGGNATYAIRTLRATIEYMERQDDEILRALARHSRIEVLTVLEIAERTGADLLDYAEALEPSEREAVAA